MRAVTHHPALFLVLFCGALLTQICHPSLDLHSLLSKEAAVCVRACLLNVYVERFGVVEKVGWGGGGGGGAGGYYSYRPTSLSPSQDAPKLRSAPRKTLQKSFQLLLQDCAELYGHRKKNVWEREAN